MSRARQYGKRQALIHSLNTGAGAMFLHIFVLPGRFNSATSQILPYIRFGSEHHLYISPLLLSSDSRISCWNLHGASTSFCDFSCTFGFDEIPPVDICWRLVEGSRDEWHFVGLI
jgi:hypothetical protein